MATRQYRRDSQGRFAGSNGGTTTTTGKAGGGGSKNGNKASAQKGMKVSKNSNSKAKQTSNKKSKVVKKSKNRKKLTRGQKTLIGLASYYAANAAGVWAITGGPTRLKRNSMNAMMKVAKKQNLANQAKAAANANAVKMGIGSGSATLKMTKRKRNGSYKIRS